VNEQLMQFESALIVSPNFVGAGLEKLSPKAFAVLASLIDQIRLQRTPKEEQVMTQIAEIAADPAAFLQEFVRKNTPK
jgi:hypothetical protein